MQKREFIHNLVTNKRLFGLLRFTLPAALIGTGGLLSAQLLEPIITQEIIIQDAAAAAREASSITPGSTHVTIICTKASDNTIACTDQAGNPLPLNCISSEGDAITCTDADGNPIDPATIGYETIVEVEKEVVKEVEKEVIVEKEIIIEKISPTLIASAQTPTIATNGDVTLTLSFDKDIALPTGWTYSGPKSQITRIFSANTTSILTVTDLAGNTGQAPIHIANIDKTAPTCGPKVTGGGTSYYYTITCNEAVTIADWDKIDAHTYARLYTSFQVGTTIDAVDLAGNRMSVPLH